MKISGFATLAFMLIITQSCNKDEYKVIEGGESPPTRLELSYLFEAKLATKATNINFDAVAGLDWTSLKGVRLQIPGGCLRKNGNIVTGQVALSYIEIFDKGNMLTTNKPTMAIGNILSGQQLLVSGGEFFIQAIQVDVKLTLANPILLTIPTSLTGGTQTAMLPFVGTIGSDGNLAWSEPLTVYEVLTNTGQPPLNNATYTAILSGFGWFNCDKFYNIAGPKTTISVNVPKGFGICSEVYLAVKSIPNSLGRIGGQFPVGLNCNLIFVTTKAGKFRYAIKPQVLTVNHKVNFDLSETTLGSADELTTAINALP